MKEALLAWMLLPGFATRAQSIRQRPIDRKSLTERHCVVITRPDSLSSLTLGNGSFAFTVDPTGMQSFAKFYRRGLPLQTESDWGWHRFPNPHRYSLRDVTRLFEVHGRAVPYVDAFKSPARKKKATAYLRANPQRLNLGQFRMQLTRSDGRAARLSDLDSIHQVLDLWKGEVFSHFKLDGRLVRVRSFCDPDADRMVYRIHSSLMSEGHLRLELAFPYASASWDEASDWTKPDRHQSLASRVNDHCYRIQRILDSTRYEVYVSWTGQASWAQTAPHHFQIRPARGTRDLEVSCLFSSLPRKKSAAVHFNRRERSCRKAWKTFWTRGGAVDLSGSTDPRAFELERRIVLSQYLTRIQCTGPLPPQETGLTYNSWYGKFHMEMILWHEAQFAVWNRWPLLEKTLGYYFRIEHRARKTARQQGYLGLRWPKMTDSSGMESPSPIGPFLIWQEPHIIYLSELGYRARPSRSLLETYKPLVFGTADFMSSYAFYDSSRSSYVLGPTLIPSQERFDKRSAIDPSFELSYWYWDLAAAVRWARRLGLAPHPAWLKVMKHLAPLALQHGIYLPEAAAADAYTNPKFLSDHPAVLETMSFIPPTPLVDTAVMNRTLDTVLSRWNWPGTWGWDYPMMAMTATRLGRPGLAIDALLMKEPKNTYLANGNNYQRSNLRIYLPGNGSLLLAVALMCAGWDHYQGPPNPGFPKNGRWKVRWENLQRLP